jgi:flagellar biosynthesis chaperone FliJ
MIRLGGLVSQKAFGKFEMGKVISNPFANAFVNEAEGSEDHEVSMANNSLDTIIKMATELKAKMGENEKDIPAWIQDHITNAENFISQASSNYHEYGQNEARIAEDKGPCWQGYKQVGMKDKGGRQVPNCVPNESVVKEISGRTPKIFVKTAAVEKKIKELMADRKKAVVPYNTEKDPKKKEILKQILIKLTKQIQGYEKNLVQLRDMEEEYLQQMHADAELDTTGL